MLDRAYSPRPLKPVMWLGSSKADLKAFPVDVVDEMGHQLFLVQCGREPDDWKSMTVTIGAGVKEIRVKDMAGAFRTVYLETRPEAVYVLHCFQKKTRQTALSDIELAKRRLRDLLNSFRGRSRGKEKNP